MGNTNRKARRSPTIVQIEKEYQELLKQYYDVAGHDLDVASTLILQSECRFRFMTPSQFEAEVKSVETTYLNGLKKK